MIALNNPVVFIYAGIFLLSLALAIWRRKTFPLIDTLMVTLIVGLGFTALVYWIAPQPGEAFLQQDMKTSELIFTVVYWIVTAILLIRGAPTPNSWKEHYFKKQIAALVFKLVVFVLIPLLALRLVWHSSWTSLGFSKGDVSGQLRAAGLLILVFGGFNLLVGGAAAPIRKRQFTLGQIATGIGLAYLWNIVEVGLVEEFYFRAFLQGRFTAFFDSPAAGICAASLLFGLAHAPGIYLRRGDRHGPLGEHPTLIDSILYAILGLSPTGWFTGLLYCRCQSLLAPILVHAAVDAVAHAAEFLEGMGYKPLHPAAPPNQFNQQSS
jgi:membrane protease YdiL (CAAX protease family)